MFEIKKAENIKKQMKKMKKTSGFLIPKKIKRKKRHNKETIFPNNHLPNLSHWEG